MPKLTWDDIGKRFYETGIDRGVLYVGTQPGVAWSGLVSIAETTSGGESKPFYYDGFKYINTSANEEFGAVIEAYTYPEEFGPCDGTAAPLNGFYITHQRRRSFGLSYRTRVGNDVSGPDFGYKIHMIYNALAEPSAKSNTTIGDTVDPENFSWTVTTRAPAIENYSRTAHFMIDTRTAPPEAVVIVEDILYGNDEVGGRLPTVEELFEIFTDNAIIIVTDNGDGSFSITGPDLLVSFIDATSWQVDSPTVTYSDAVTYTVSSS
jgi:hypothetical protein